MRCSFITFFLLLCLLLTSCQTPSQKKLSSIQSINPKKLSNVLALNHGKYILLHFWVSYYRDYSRDLNILKRIQEKYSPQNILIIGISLDPNGISAVQPVIEELELEFPIFIAGEEIPKFYQIQSLPRTLVFNPSGQLSQEIAGPLDLDQLFLRLNLPQNSK